MPIKELSSLSIIIWQLLISFKPLKSHENGDENTKNSKQIFQDYKGLKWYILTLNSINLCNVVACNTDKDSIGEGKDKSCKTDLSW